MIFTDGRGGITAIIPHRIGRSRTPGLGNLGFPWLFVGNIIVGGANAGWSYYRTKQQVQMAIAQSGSGPASNEDIRMAADAMEKVMGVGVSRSQVEDYAADMMKGSPTKQQGIAPAEFFALQQRLAALEAGKDRQASVLANIPTWGYLALAAGAFLVVRQMGFLGGR